MKITEKKNTIKDRKPFRKLGFTFLDSAEIVVALNQLLANYQVQYHKLRNFHWNIEGRDFFELHQEFQNEYNTVKLNIDIIAERIRVFGLKPSMSMTEILAISEIKEVKTDNMSAIGMTTEVLKDFDILHNKMLDVLNAALDAGDNVTEQIVTDFMRNLEKRNWIFTSWSK
ncbi:Dps family protein [Aquimarina muelleri]|uniref:DNA starvation/stationary phase protection protein n=1 Tax=Aquimarina muelleri TaxID=279356 RepID=A0A918JU93_9FLAO|nr:DNA starvation/stationary phase protection protein [Aquimarina muelleri]MCX2763927.1 DNA starvation/stationary phase protection protein [Aquimarina muelleri]GGX11166.1 DNA starvation/stationary phase protection protein [Aquimarina muelleri]